MLRDLTDRYPETKLHPIPSLPEVLVKEEKHRFFYASKEPSELLQSLQLTGYLLCDMSLECNELSLGNIFIPHQSYSETLDKLGQIVIFKNVVWVNENTFSNLRESVEYQLNLILAKIEEWIRPDFEPDSMKIPVNVVLLSAPKLKQAVETLKEETQSHFEENVSSKHFSVLAHAIARSKRNNGKDESTYTKMILNNGSNSNWVSKVLAKLILQTAREKLPDVSERRFLFPSEEKPSVCLGDLKDSTQICEMFQLYFPFFLTRLEFLPDPNRIPSSLPKDSNKLAQLQNSDYYLGKIKDFWEMFLSKLDQIAGVFIFEYGDTHLKSLFKQKMKNFQFDWILCSPQTGFTIFEIVRNRNPENASSAVENKLTGHCMWQLFVLRLILFVILRPICKNTETDLLDWLEKHTRIVLVFCNIRATVVQDAIKLHSELILDANNQFSSLFILSLIDLNSLQDNFGSNRFLQLDKNLDLFASSYRISDFLVELSNQNEFEPDNLIEYASAVLCLTSLSNAEITGQTNNTSLLIRPTRSPLEPEERFKNSCRFLDIILTPQQMQILQDDPKYLFIMGEPGSGKTSLLLVKACKAAQENDEIDQVYFAIPSQKTELRNVIEDFVQEKSRLDERLNKIKCLTFEELFGLQKSQGNSENKLTWKKLHRSVVVVDEIYLESTEKLTDGDEKFGLAQLPDMLYHAKQAWFTNLQAGQMTRRKNIYHKILAPNFRIATLNILLRNAHHISAFSTSFIHTTKTITMSSARIPGCFLSSQVKIPLVEFSRFDEVTSRIFSITNPVFAEKRRVIIFSDRPDYWSKNKVVNSTIVSSKSNFLSAPFSGCEAQSVIIVVDDLPHEVHDKRTFGVITLAITRAQYEVCVFANEKCFKRVQQFLSYKNTHIEKAMFDAANNCRFTCKFDEYSKWDNDTHNLVTSLLQIAIQTSNTQLFDDVVNLYPGQDGYKPLPLKKILSSFDCPKPQKFMEHLSKRIGKQTGSFLEWMIRINRFPKYFPGSSHVSELFDTGVTVGYTSMVDWYFALVSHDQVKNLLIRYKRTLFSACQNGRYSTLQWAFDKLAFYSLDNLKEIELRSKYFFVFRDDATLLLVLCYARCELDAIELLFQEGFPNELLLETYMGKNALQLAIEYEDQELISLLLRCNKRRTIFFSSEAKYGGFSNPVEYAKFLEFSEMEQLLISHSSSHTAEI